MAGLRLIVGLGNPGPEHARTRHNAGFRFVDTLAEKEGVRFGLESKLFGETAKIHIGGESIWLLKPSTFMNLSGRAVRAAIDFYKLDPTAVVVVHDELDLPLGRMRLKRGGGNAGHNGLKSITQELGTPDFVRLRLGIGHPGDRNEVINYVLKAPRREEQDLESLGYVVRGVGTSGACHHSSHNS